MINQEFNGLPIFNIVSDLPGKGSSGGIVNIEV